VEHLRRLGARARATVVDAIEERLSFEPAVETRNRKRMEENPLEAAFELRVGALRVYYVVEEDTRIVNVLAVGLKDRDRVIIGGEEIEL
jgi:mRNA-degrading endonuclease RelE of RelBE toxin-antitoxin system